MTQRRLPTSCENMNHRRVDAPVPYCPQCGETVNQRLPRRNCDADQHAVSRRQGSVFCVGCGTKLITRRL